MDSRSVARKRARSRRSSSVSLALPKHQRQSPVFSERPIPTKEEERQEWLETLAMTTSMC